MQLPRVKIQFLTGQLGTVGDNPDVRRCCRWEHVRAEHGV